MRLLNAGTINKRGCDECGDKTYNPGNHQMYCQHEKCPYAELDSIANWKQYDAPARKRAARATKWLGKKVVAV